MTSTGIKLGQPSGHLKAGSHTLPTLRLRECFRAGLSLPLHLLLSTRAAQAGVGNVCAYHGIWIVWIWQGHSHMAAREAQVTFLASPLTQIS